MESSKKSYKYVKNYIFDIIVRMLNKHLKSIIVLNIASYIYIIIYWLKQTKNNSVLFKNQPKTQQATTTPITYSNIIFQ